MARRFDQMIRNSSAAPVLSQVEELVKSKLEKPKKLLQLAAREWREIDDNTLVFGRPAAEVTELKQLTKADLISFFKVSLPILFSPSVVCKCPLLSYLALYKKLQEVCAPCTLHASDMACCSVSIALSIGTCHITCCHWLSSMALLAILLQLQ